MQFQICPNLYLDNQDLVIISNPKLKSSILNFSKTKQLYKLILLILKKASRCIKLNAMKDAISWIWPISWFCFKSPTNVFTNHIQNSTKFIDINNFIICLLKGRYKSHSQMCIYLHDGQISIILFYNLKYQAHSQVLGTHIFELPTCNFKITTFFCYIEGQPKLGRMKLAPHSNSYM